MKQSKIVFLLMLAAYLPLHANDERELRDIERELRIIAAASKARPPTASELEHLRKFKGRDLSDIRRTLEIIRRNAEANPSSKLRIGGASAPRISRKK